MLKIWNYLHQVRSKSGITFIRYAQNLELPSSGTLKIWNYLHQVRSKSGITYFNLMKVIPDEGNSRF
jgi:DUF971 family protein